MGQVVEKLTEQHSSQEELILSKGQLPFSPSQKPQCFILDFQSVHIKHSPTNTYEAQEILPSKPRRQQR